MKIIVNVKPNAGKNKIEKIKEGEYLIKIKERAEEGKANRAVIKLLCKEFGMDFRKIEIKNPRARMKVVEIMTK